MDHIMTPTWRKPIGILSLLLYIIIWVFLVASASSLIEQLPVILQTVIYLFLGIIWIYPLKPALFWMEHGHMPKKIKAGDDEIIDEKGAKS